MDKKIMMFLQGVPQYGTPFLYLCIAPIQDLNNACRACITAGPTYIITNLKTKTNL